MSSDAIIRLLPTLIKKTLNTMSIATPTKLKHDLTRTVREFGYQSEHDFVADAIEHRILTLKRARFSERVEDIRKAMKKKGLSEAEILKDFDGFRRAPA